MGNLLHNISRLGFDSNLLFLIPYGATEKTIEEPG
jgi:hypothetical protein